MRSAQIGQPTSQTSGPAEALESKLISTVIIGAGPAGLSVAACLKKAHIPAIILEKEDRVGSSWAKFYERLRLNTNKRDSALPDLPFPPSYPKYPSRREVIAYLESYARHFELRPRLKERVLSAQRQDNFWETRTTSATYRSANLVVATGNNQQANIPKWKGQEGFPGEIFHCIDYKSGRPFKGQNVLVVGIGNSGSEIALDLYEHGARVSVCVKGPVNILPREILGIPVLRTVSRLTEMPLAFSDYLRSVLFKLVCYNLPQRGIVRPSYDPITQTNRFGKLPSIDNGTIAKIKSGEITIYPGIAAFHKKEIHFKNGDRDQFDTVFLATGYQPRLDTFLKVDPGLLNNHGGPRRRLCISEVPGLCFCGFAVSSRGILNKIGEDARQICQHISDTKSA